MRRTKMLEDFAALCRSGPDIQVYVLYLGASRALVAFRMIVVSVLRSVVAVQGLANGSNWTMTQGQRLAGSTRRTRMPPRRVSEACIIMCALHLKMMLVFGWCCFQKRTRPADGDRSGTVRHDETPAWSLAIPLVSRLWLGKS